MFEAMSPLTPWNEMAVWHLQGLYCGYVELSTTDLISENL